MLARGKDLVEEAGALSPHSGAGFRRLPEGPQSQTAAAAPAAADRQEPERGRLARHRAGLGRRYRREARRARHLHPRAARHRRHRRAVHRGARSSMSACSATTGCGCCRFGSWSSEASAPARSDIATEKVKHDPDYQERRGVDPRAGQGSRARSCARGSRASPSASAARSRLDGYSRIDFRLSADGTPYFLEANPNPEIAKSQEFATPPTTTACPIRICSSASWRSASARAEAGVSLG